MRSYKRYTAILILLIMPLNLDAGKYKKHDAIINKTVKAYRAMGRSRVGWKVLGYSVKKNKIFFREFGKGERTLLVIGGMHGDEPAATMAVIKFGEYLHNCPELLTGRVVLIPCINPDGLMRGTRTNANRVDINRNFISDTWTQDYGKEHNNPGKFPASEPETVLIINAIHDYSPWMTIQVHQPFAAIYPSNRVDEKLYENMSALSGLPVKFSVGYDTPGSFGSYTDREDLAIPGITFELGSIFEEPDYDRINLALLEAANYM